MANVEEARIILKTLGLPPAQSNEMSALTLLSLCGLGPDDPWSKATRIRCTVTKGIMDYVREKFGKEYAPNTRETFRRQVRAFAEKFKWIKYYTPVHEIYITATFSAQYGWWNERISSDRHFVTALKHLCMANVLAMQAILEAQPEARTTRATTPNRPTGPENAGRNTSRNMLSTSHLPHACLP